MKDAPACRSAPPLSRLTAHIDADVIIVGAGPGGSTAAAHLARAGVEVLLLEKTTFPREKVCGDGLTPRAVKSLLSLGVDTSDWPRNRGLRILGGKHRLELDWPDLASFPITVWYARASTSMRSSPARRRSRGPFCVKPPPSPARCVTSAPTASIGVQLKNGSVLRAPLVLAADGVSARTALGAGIASATTARWALPFGAIWSPRPAAMMTTSNPTSSSGTVRRGEGRLLPGYGWIFGVGDGTVNVGLGILNTSDAFGHVDYKDLLRRWLAEIPDLADRELLAPVRGGALPMGFNRQPHYRDGLLLIGDAAGAVNPFNGEGIAYAMETAETAADIVIQALARAEGRCREQALAAYPAALSAQYGGYFTLGRWFVSLIGHPAVMSFATKYGLPRPTLMRFTLKLLANLTDPRGGDALDRLINGLSRVAPAA